MSIPFDDVLEMVSENKPLNVAWFVILMRSIALETEAFMLPPPGNEGRYIALIKSFDNLRKSLSAVGGAAHQDEGAAHSDVWERALDLAAQCILLAIRGDAEWDYNPAKVKRKPEAKSQDDTQASLHLRAAALDLYNALVMVRDADDDCRRDGLATIPETARQTIDAALAKAGGGK